MSNEFTNIENAIFYILDVGGQRRYPILPYLENEEEEILERLPKEEAFNELCKYTNQDSIEERVFDAIALLRSGSALYFLVKNLENNNNFYRMMVCDKLSYFKNEKSYDVLFKIALNDVDVDVRTMSISILANSGDSYVIPMLIEISNRNDNEVGSQGFTPSESASILLTVFGQ
jgi:hypothetical protein